MRRASFSFVALLALSLVACRKSTSADAGRPRELPIERTRLAAPRAVSTSTAFDLVPIASGAYLTWGRPSRLGGGIVALRLDAWGGAVGSDVVLFAPELPAGGTTAERIAEDALEIDAAVARGSLAVLWVARNQLDLSVRSLVGDLASLRAAAPLSLGRTKRAITNGRGWVGVAASDDGTFHALMRLEELPCSDASAGPCVGVGHAELGPTEARAFGVPLAVPAPCETLLVGAAWVGRRFHYGVCSAVSGAPETTIYTIEPAISVARSEQVLPGCVPEGMLVADRELLVAGRCPGGRAGARMAESGQAMRSMQMDRVTVRCEGRTPILSTSSQLGATIRLVAPVDGLEALLPETFAPAGSRVVWTGQTVLVAQPIGGEVSLHRFGCEEGTFQQTDFF